MNDTPQAFTSEEETLLAAFLGASAEDFKSSEQEVVKGNEMPVANNDSDLDLINDELNAENDLPADIKDETREELVQHAETCFEYCASYNRSRTHKMLSMLGTVHLRHLVSMLEELIDPDLSEKRWKEMNEKARERSMAAALCELQELDHTHPLSEDDDDDDIEVNIEEDFQLTTDCINDSDLSTDLSSMSSVSSMSGITDISTQNIGVVPMNQAVKTMSSLVEQAVLASAAQSEKSLFSPPLEDKEQWSNTPVDLDNPRGWIG